MAGTPARLFLIWRLILRGESLCQNQKRAGVPLHLEEACLNSGPSPRGLYRQSAGSPFRLSLSPVERGEPGRKRRAPIGSRFRRVPIAPPTRSPCTRTVWPVRSWLPDAQFDPPTLLLRRKCVPKGSQYRSVAIGPRSNAPVPPPC